MAIKLEIQPYCECCTVFDPDVERPEKLCTMCADGSSDVYITDTIVRCRRRNTCAGIKRYLEKQMQKGEQE